MRTLIKLVIIIFSLTAGVSEGVEVGGVNLPDTLLSGDTKLILNGAGLRKKLFVKVYAAGLYLEEKQSDPTAIIQADRPMAIRMHFIYDGVTPKQLVDTWNEGFAASTGDKRASLQDRLNTFNGFFTEKAQKGDRYDLSLPDGRGGYPFHQPKAHRYGSRARFQESSLCNLARRETRGCRSEIRVTGKIRNQMHPAKIGVKRRFRSGFASS